MRGRTGMVMLKHVSSQMANNDVLFVKERIFAFVSSALVEKGSHCWAWEVERKKINCVQEMEMGR